MFYYWGAIKPETKMKNEKKKIDAVKVTHGMKMIELMFLFFSFFLLLKWKKRRVVETHIVALHLFVRPITKPSQHISFLSHTKFTGVVKA